jgi:hypothetical protein
VITERALPVPRRFDRVNPLSTPAPEEASPTTTTTSTNPNGSNSEEHENIESEAASADHWKRSLDLHPGRKGNVHTQQFEIRGTVSVTRVTDEHGTYGSWKGDRIYFQRLLSSRLHQDFDGIVLQSSRTVERAWRAALPMKIAVSGLLSASAP